MVAALSWWQWLAIVLGWVLAVLFGGVVLVACCVWIDALLTRRKLQSRTTLSRTLGENKNTLILALPGILASENSFDPILGTLQKYGDVRTVGYHGEKFDLRKTVRILASELKNEATVYEHLIFFGVSKGGLLALDVQQELRRTKREWRLVDFVPVDSPSGAADMLGGGNIAAVSLRAFPTGKGFNYPGGKLLNAMLVPPRDENIEPQLDNAQVKKRALLAMSSFPFSIYRDQLAYMAARPRLTAEMFDGFNRVAYIRCDRNNETVAQPQASLKFVAAGGDKVEVIAADLTHAGFAERPVTANAVVDAALHYITTGIRI